LAVAHNQPDPLNRDLPRPAERKELPAPTEDSPPSRDDAGFDLWDETGDGHPDDEMDDDDENEAYNADDYAEDDHDDPPSNGNDKRHPGRWTAESA
jgi:hypothetical protein